MKKWMILSTAGLLAVALTGCTSAYYASSGYAGDDLYATHDKTEIARRQQQAAEERRAQAEARRAEWEARIAEAEAAAAENKYNSTVAGAGNYTYSGVVADTYESAYARRLRGFESLTYRMPSSYYNFRYGDAFTYVSAYDPAFYNIVISGDQVWVEPKYISSMFGTWGATVLPGGWYGGWYGGWNYGWNYAWSRNPLWWGYGSWGWNWGFAWNPWHAPWYRPGWGAAWAPGWGHAPGFGGWGYRPAPHNYRLDSYRRAAGTSTWRANSAPAGNRNGSGSSVNSGRSGSYNNNGRSGSYNNTRPNSNPGNRSGNNNWNNSNSGRSNYNYNNNSGRSGSTSGYSGSSGRSGDGSYNRGR